MLGAFSRREDLSLRARDARIKHLETEMLGKNARIKLQKDEIMRLHGILKENGYAEGS